MIAYLAWVDEIARSDGKAARPDQFNYPWERSGLGQTRTTAN
jgi:hypothetical protein